MHGQPHIELTMYTSLKLCVV